MNEQLATPLNDMIRSAQVQVPEQVRDMIEESLKATRTSWEAMSSSFNDAAVAQNNAAKAFGDQLLRSMTTNFDATSDAVQALTKAKTVSDVQNIQVNFLRDHTARLMKQWNDWLSLSMKLGEDAAEALSDITMAPARAAKKR